MHSKTPKILPIAIPISTPLYLSTLCKQESTLYLRHRNSSGVGRADSGIRNVRKGLQMAALSAYKDIPSGLTVFRHDAAKDHGYVVTTH